MNSAFVFRAKSQSALHYRVCLMCWIRLTKKPQTLLTICDAIRPGVPRISRLRWRWGARCQTIWRHGRRQRAYREVFTACLATGTPPTQRAGGKSKTKLRACPIISKHSFGHTKNRCVKRALQISATCHCPSLQSGLGSTKD